MRTNFDLLVVFLLVGSVASSRPIAPGTSGLYTLIDPRLIKTQSNVLLELGNVTKSKHNPLLSETMPWDGNWLNSNPSIIHKDGVFHLFWTAKLVCPGANPKICTREKGADRCCHPGFNHSIPSSAKQSGGLLYANSSDGVTFYRPKLGLNMILGSAANNVIFSRPGGSAGQMGIFLDDHVTPSVFRAFGKAFPATVGLPAVPFATSGGMGVATSSDGLHWENWTSAAGLDVNGDTSNNALWDPHLRQYLGFSRLDNHINYDRWGIFRCCRQLEV